MSAPWTSGALTRTAQTLAIGILIGGLNSAATAKAHGQPPSLPTNIEQVPVWRLQVFFATCDVKDAGTDDNVFVQFRSDSTRRFFIDYGGDDRERGKQEWFDVSPSILGVTTVASISQLTIGKRGENQLAPIGTDGWCLSVVKLRINGSVEPVFAKTFRQGQWIDGNDSRRPTLTIAGTELRADRNWSIRANPVVAFPPIVLASSDLERIVEGITGHSISTNKVYWGKQHGRWVEVSRKNDSTVHVDLDLAYESPLPDPEVDVDFDLVIGCTNNRLTITPKNTHVDIDGNAVVSLLTLGLQLVVDEIAEYFAQDAISFPSSSAPVPVCPRVTVRNGGSIAFDWGISFRADGVARSHR